MPFVDVLSAVIVRYVSHVDTEHARKLTRFEYSLLAHKVLLNSVLPSQCCGLWDRSGERWSKTKVSKTWSKRLGVCFMEI